MAFAKRGVDHLPFSTMECVHACALRRDFSGSSGIEVFGAAGCGLGSALATGGWGPEPVSLVAGPHPSGPLGPGELRIELRSAADALIVVLRGELDLASAATLEQVLRDSEASPGRLVVDLSDLDFIDSTGIHVLLQAQRRAGGRLSLRRGPDAVQRVLELTRVADCFTFDDGAVDSRPASQASHAQSQRTATGDGQLPAR